MKGTINPQMKEMPCGNRELRTIRMYPLSFRDQARSVDIIVDFVHAFLEMYAEAKTGLIKKAFAPVETPTEDASAETPTDAEEAAAEEVFAVLEGQSPSLETDKDGVAEDDAPFVIDADIILNLLELVEANIGRILELVSDKNKEEIAQLVEVMTNEQLVDIATAIWEMNYERALKNGKGLFKRIKGK